MFEFRLLVIIFVELDLCHEIFYMKEEIKIGIIVGKGVGKELSIIFKDFLTYYAQKKYNYQKDVKIKFFEHEGAFDTYGSLKGLEPLRIKQQSEKDVKVLKQLLEEWAKEGVQTVFRTSINAESLYELRRDLNAVKVFNVTTRAKGGEKGNEILIIRDEMQGYYTNENYQYNPLTESISFTGNFKKANFEKLIRYSQEYADQTLGKENYMVWIVYKFHLFANILEKWVTEIDPNLKFYQPDTGLSEFFDYMNDPKKQAKHLVLITSNEVGDIIYEFVTERFRLGHKNELYSKNIYLHDSLNKPIIYQTVHGSADDIEGKGTVNPLATLRIVADILQNSLGIAKFRGSMELAIADVQSQSSVTENVGGTKKTKEMLGEIEYQLNLNLKEIYSEI